MSELNSVERNRLEDIESKYYMKPSIENISIKIDEEDDKQNAWINLFDNLHDILIETKDEVDELLEQRRQSGEIDNIEQARKNIAGNAFSNLLIYVFLKNKENGNIRSDIYITSKKSDIRNFDKIATIDIDGETQKPDVDIIIYTLKENNEVKKCIILSLKTSLRERAGQTFKWKLLLEIATTENEIKKKYNINYNPDIMPIVCFATVNFYNEINKPQHRGMFKFFDKSFIGKPNYSDFVLSLSSLPDYVNRIL